VTDDGIDRRRTWRSARTRWQALWRAQQKARQLIIEAEYEGLLTPVEYLLGLMRDNNMPVRHRTAAAIAVAPYLHPKLSMHRITGDPEQMTDEQLLARVAQLEAIAAAMPERERLAALEAQLDQAIDEVQQLPPPRRESLFRKMAEASEAGLRRLNEPPPGAVLRRPSDQRQPSAEPPADLRYDPHTRKLLPAA
jgi:hypothetical protein